MEKKKCLECNEIKSISEFSKNKRRKDGLCIYCKSCMKIRNTAWRNSNSEKVKNGKKRYRKKYAEKIRNYNREYQKRDYVIKKANQHIKKRYSEDEIFKLKMVIRSEIYSSFTRKKYIKQENTEQIIGCSIDELITHLKKTYFKNYGEEYDKSKDVHIDHIIPLATANSEDEVKKLCHYSNLQLLKDSDNLEKAAKLDWKLTTI